MVTRRWGSALGALAITTAATLGGAVPASAVPGSASPDSASRDRASPGSASPDRASPGSAGPGGTLGWHRVLRSSVLTENWAGYIVSGGTYKSVYASWTQPAVTCTSGSRLAGFWVGLDGFQSKTVEQTGTVTTCAKGKPSAAGWYELVPMEAEVNYRNRVSPGDRIAAAVVSLDGGKYDFILSDKTRHWTHSTVQSEPGTQRSSAEVIAEAPSSGDSVLPLADFRKVNFTGALVDASPIGDLSPLQATMITSHGADMATASPLRDGTSFSVTWKASG